MTTTYISDLYPVENDLVRIEKEFVQLTSNNTSELDLTGAIQEVRLYIQDYLANQHLPSNNPRGASVEPWVYKDENDEYYIEVNLGCYGLNSHKRRFYISDWTEAPKQATANESKQMNYRKQKVQARTLYDGQSDGYTIVQLKLYWGNYSHWVKTEKIDSYLSHFDK